MMVNIVQVYIFYIVNHCAKSGQSKPRKRSDLQLPLE